MDRSQKKRPASSDAGKKRKKNNVTSDAQIDTSSSCDKSYKRSDKPKVEKISTKIRRKNYETVLKQKKKSVKSDPKNKIKRINFKIDAPTPSTSSSCDKNSKRFDETEVDEISTRNKIMKLEAGCYQKKKSVKSDPKNKRKKINFKINAPTPSTSSSCDKNYKRFDETEVDNIARKTKTKKQGAGHNQKKKSVSADAKKNNRKIKRKHNAVPVISTNVKNSAPKKPKQSNASEIDVLPSTSFSTYHSKPSTSAGREKPCAFYRVTEDENGRPVFSKALLKYFLTPDSPEYHDLKKKRWNTSFLHETPIPNRVIKIFTDEEDQDPRYQPNLPEIESNLPDVPGTLYTDIFKSMPLDSCDEELKKAFKEIPPVIGPDGKKKRKSTRFKFDGKPFSCEQFTYDYDA